MKKVWIFIALFVFAGCRETADIVDEPQWISLSGGTFTFGHRDGMENEKPEVNVNVEGIEISSTEISNAMFEAFVNATGYVTDAERTGSSFVYTDRWKEVTGADWRHPEGPHSSVLEKMDHPVVNVSWNDAQAYCRWIGGRLPTETEWESACKTGIVQGAEMNIEGNDAFSRTAPVQSMKSDRNGVYHLQGNVWEWCEDSYHYEIHDRLLAQGIRNTKAYTGKSFDPNEDSEDTLRVIKGGSFLCHDGFCAGYLPYARQHAPQDGSYFHIGFRVVKKRIE